MLPIPFPTPWSNTPQDTLTPLRPFQHPEGLTATIATKASRKLSPTQTQELNEMNAMNSSKINGQMSDCGLPQLQEGLVEQVQSAVNLFVNGPVTQVVNQESTALKLPPALALSTQENSESVLPGIETLLSAIQVVEGESPSANNEAATFTKITALNSPNSAKARLVFVSYY